MFSDIVIRQCTARDIPRVLDLWSRGAAEAPMPDTADAVRNRLRRDREFFLLACDGPEVVGSIMAGWDGWRGNMYRLAVDPAYRRKGLAGRLLREVESRLRALGVKRITALVIKDSPPAIPFWEDAGYLADHSVQRYFKNL